LLILCLLTFIIDEVGVPNPALLSLVAVLGVVGIAAAAWTANRKLDISSSGALAQSYRRNFVVAYVLNQTPLLVSFVLCFLLNELCPYLIFLIGMAVIAPSRRNFARRQEQVHHQGSTLSLGRALSYPGG
jgi:hypothetical protein